LLNTFGQALCDIFFFPYNEKCWKYPLGDMTSEGQTWNINKPFDAGKTYNAEGYYPMPHKRAPFRGMEILPREMAKKVSRLELDCEVTSIDMQKHEVRTSEGLFRYDLECLSTIPLPYLAQLCDIPRSLKSDISKLRWNKVISVGITIQGERPRNTGHWHYYAQPEFPFSKLIYMTEFDEYNAPADGFGILAEIPEMANDRSFSVQRLLPSLQKLNILNSKNRLLGMHVWEVNPAYVVFTKETPSIVDNCIEYFDKFGIRLLGRYGNWEYSSMAENIESGFNYASKIIKR
jgi:protoporphyrinogen oxidase